MWAVLTSSKNRSTLNTVHYTEKKKFLYKLLKIKFVKNIFRKTGGDHFDIGTTDTAITLVGEIGELKLF